MSSNIVGFGNYAKPKFVLDDGELKIIGSPVPSPEEILKWDYVRPRIYDVWSIIAFGVKAKFGSRQKAWEKLTRSILDQMVETIDGMGAIPIEEMSKMRFNRRHFLKMMAGGTAATILAACRIARSAVAPAKPATRPTAKPAPQSSVSTAIDADTTFSVTQPNMDYYVDINYGNDNGAGSISDPWKTIKKARNSVQAGDTVHIRAGDYRTEGMINIKKTGVEGAPVRFIAYEQEQPIINGLKIHSSQWIEISKLRIIGPKNLPANWRDMPAVVVDDPSVGPIEPTQPWSSGRKQQVFRKYATYANLREQWTKQWTAGVSIESSDHILIKDNEISHHSAGINVSNESANIIADNNRLHHLGIGFRSGYTKGYKYSVKDSVISHNHVFQNLASGIRVINNAHNNVVENNVVEFNGINHIGTHSGSTNNLIRQNLLTNGGYYSEAMENPGASGISINSSGSGNRVEGNHIAYQYDVTLRDGNGVIVDRTPPGAVVANNVIYRNMGSGVTSTASSNSIIIHNTIVENGYNTTAKWNGVGIRTSRDNDINNVIAANILSNNSRGGMYFGGRLSQQKYVDHNLFYSPNGAPLVSDDWQDRKSYYDLPSYQTTGFGTHSVVAAPMFIDANQGDYHLQVNSPAVNSGTSEYTTQYDKDSRIRPQGSQPDIGAFEYHPQ